MSAHTCSECGCTEDNACLTIFGPCQWVSENLCSACLDPNIKVRGPAFESPVLGPDGYPASGPEPEHRLILPGDPDFV